MSVTFIWDEEKNKTNKKKHGINFEEAIGIFEDPYLIEIYDEKHSTIEEDRYIGLGSIENIILLYVVFTDKKGIIRLISARKAEPKEAEVYYEHYRQNI